MRLTCAVHQSLLAQQLGQQVALVTAYVCQPGFVVPDSLQPLTSPLQRLEFLGITHT
jgi:hypothetical protein